MTTKKRDITMKYSYLLLLCVLLLNACTGVINSEEEAPILTRTVTDLSVLKNQQVELTMEYVDAYDINGDDMTLIVSSGENYTLSGTTVIPDNNFVGDLHVPVQVKDNTGKLSNRRIIIISVLPDLREIQPLYVGAEWIFADTFFTIDSATTSRLEITEEFNTAVPGIIGESYVMRWRNADSLNLNFIYHSSDSGSIRVGGNSPSDTMSALGMKLKYPVNEGDSWSFSPMEYNIDNSNFFLDTDVTEMRCNDTCIYVTVPAGTFKCIEYEYSLPYTSTGSRSAESVILPDGNSVTIPRSSRGAEYTITVKLYYALGVGYVQNLTYVGDTLVIRKALIDYTVVEK